MICLSHHTVHFRVPSLWGKRGTAELKQKIENVGGVVSVSINSSINRISIDYDNLNTSCGKIKEIIEAAGYSSEVIANHDHGV